MIDRIEGNEDPDAPVSLREMVNFIDNVVFSLNESFVDQEKLIFFERFLIRIQSDFEVNSVFHRLIDKPESDLALFITELMESIRREKFELGDKISHLDVKGSIPIPKEYTDLLLIKELITNVKNHAVKGPSSVVELSGTIIENGGITLIIKNKIRIDELYKGNGEGSKCFKLLEEFSPFHFSYDGFEENGNFIQELNFNF
jgi:two-component sensor histidine kinase